MNTELDALNPTAKKVVHNAAQAIGEFLENKIADKIVKPKHWIDENPRNVAEVIIHSGKKKKY